MSTFQLTYAIVTLTVVAVEAALSVIIYSKLWGRPRLGTYSLPGAIEETLLLLLMAAGAILALHGCLR